MSDSPVALRDLLLTTTRTLRRRWHDLLQPWGLSPHEYRALDVIARHQERLGRWLGLSGPASGLGGWVVAGWSATGVATAVAVPLVYQADVMDEAKAK